MSTKHKESPSDFDKTYEENTIGLKGIVWFGVGLFLLVVITFSLMWAFLGALKDYRHDEEKAAGANPLAMTDKERLPPEPRLQSAPGFKVDSEKGTVNLELMAPQSEWRELKKEWANLVEHGQKDLKTGTVISLPIETAIDKYLEGSIKAKKGPEAEKFFEESHKFVSDASAGRRADETRR